MQNSSNFLLHHATVLLQNAIGFLLRITTVLLQNGTFITKCVNLITKCNVYYKMRQHTEPFGPLLKLWAVMEEERQMAMKDIIGTMHFAFGKTFNTKSYFRWKSMLDTLIDGKSKFKEISK